MTLRESKIIPDVQVFRARGVSQEYGRKVMLAMAERGDIEPLRTATGRYRLSIDDAELLAQSL